MVFDRAADGKEQRALAVAVDGEDVDVATRRGARDGVELQCVRLIAVDAVGDELAVARAAQRQVVRPARFGRRLEPVPRGDLVEAEGGVAEDDGEIAGGGDPSGAKWEAGGTAV